MIVMPSGAAPIVPAAVPRPRPRSSSSDLVAQWLVAGLFAGLVAGALFGFPRAGESLGAPALWVLGGLLVGGAAGALVGALLSAARGSTPAPRPVVAPRAPRLEPPPAPPHLDDFALPEAQDDQPFAAPGW